MSAALWVWKYWRIATARLRVKAVTGDLSSAVTRGTHVTRSLCLPKSLSSWSFLPVKTPSALWSRGKAEGICLQACRLQRGTSRRERLGVNNQERKTIHNMDKSCPAKEEQPQNSRKSEEEQPQAQHSPEEQCPEELSSEEQSSEEEFFPEELLPELLPEMLLSEERPPEERLSSQDLFQAHPPMEQPPCGVGKHKLEEGSFKERLARSRPQFKGDIHGKNLSNEEMIKVAEEMEEMKRVRNKLMIMHWKARRNRPYPI
ncbi:transcription elongation factor A protein-like 1 isoform X2 [Phyllostomus discolor]|uniref:Transcription elongation factor A protein-like 1 isoform X2 n=1 Tax=Phyllostomus discolor TaxID=89673 RepID=A0A7E6CZU2_9CHIR|nr:transcription elongation factor A protein-like 1 isoform X2 [Phyllostomus discolor]